MPPPAAATAGRRPKPGARPDDGDVIERLAADLSERLRRGSPRVAFPWLVKFTPAGRMLTLALIPAGAIAGGLGISFPLYFFALVLFTLTVLDQVVGLALRPHLSIERDLPERCAAGARIQVRARVVNLNRRLPALDLAITELSPPIALRVTASPYLERLDAGESAEFTYELEATRRGAWDLKGPIGLTAWPFGLCHNLRAVPASRRLLVYPRFSPLGAVDLPVGSKHQPGGLSLVSRVGESEEFVGNREYRPGDRLRDLDQRAWARVGHPVVREFQQEYLQRVALVVDTHAPLKDTAAEAALEAAISLGAAVADALSRMEYVIDLFAAGPDLFHLQAGRSLAYLDSILDILACIEPCRTSPFGTLAPAIREQVGQIGSAVVVLLDWSEDRQAFVDSLRSCGVAVKVVVVRDGLPTLDPRGVVVEGGPVKLLSVAQATQGGDRL